MGWTYLADECEKIENALQAMLLASKLNLRKPGTKPTPGKEPVQK